MSKEKSALNSNQKSKQRHDLGKQRVGFQLTLGNLRPETGGAAGFHH